MGDPMTIAESIRKTVREELGLTVSIGVSFNKIFAKLGSDMKKPDAITEITSDNFQEKVWPLDASEMIYCGNATRKKLETYGIHTIGDVAHADEPFLRRLLGVHGSELWKIPSRSPIMSLPGSSLIAMSTSAGSCSMLQWPQKSHSEGTDLSRRQDNYMAGAEGPQYTTSQKSHCWSNSTFTFLPKPITFSGKTRFFELYMYNLMMERWKNHGLFHWRHPWVALQTAGLLSVHGRLYIAL